MHVYELECAVSDVLFKMETRGARIDIPFCEEKYDQLIQYVAETREWCVKNYGVSPGAKDDVIHRLQHDGIEFTKRTAGGSYALDEDVLLRCDHPLARTVLNIRKSQKIASAYFSNFLTLADHDILHCSVKQVGARTGRMSITEPALQTLPRDNKSVRNAFIPSDGNRLVTIDYKQVEMRVFAHFAQETEMINRIRSGVDMHDAVAQVIYGIEEVPKPPSNHQERQLRQSVLRWCRQVRTDCGHHRRRGRRVLRQVRRDVPRCEAVPERVDGCGA